jgi:hypothetical protein
MHPRDLKAHSDSWSSICSQAEKAAAAASSLTVKDCERLEKTRLQLPTLPQVTTADLPAVLQELKVKLEVSFYSAVLFIVRK